MTSTISSSPLLEMRGIVKRFGTVTALSNVDFSVRPGEIHALLGHNGAGKSALMNILAGVYSVDEGEVLINRAAVNFAHPRDALKQGIGIVYQDLSLVPDLSVADNIFLGREAGNGFIINEPEIARQTVAILQTLGIQHIDLKTVVKTLSLAQQQLAEIAKVLSYEPRILVLDEPTASLADKETTLLFSLLDALHKRGIAIIFISHRFKEVLQHCHRATILRNGQLVTTVDLTGISENELIELTIGGHIDSYFSHHPEPPEREVALEVEALKVGRSVRGVSFKLHRGEIVGLTGLLGAGQNEVARALFGIETQVSGLIRCNNHPVLITSPRVAIRLGIALLNEQRKIEGLILDMNVRENITLPSLSLFRRLGLLIKRAPEQRAAKTYIDQLAIRTPSSEVAVNTLSGGNQQKTILAKWLLRDLNILIFINPTQGIDVGARAEIYQHLSELAAHGKTILVVSDDLLEILGVSDRILTMYNGVLTREIPRAEASEEVLLSAIQGNRAEELVHEQAGR